MNRNYVKKYFNILLILTILINMVFLLSYYFTTRKRILIDPYAQTKDTRLYKIKSLQIEDIYCHLENWKDSILLSTLVKNKPKLILRVPTVYCKMCESQELDNLKYLYEVEGFHNICAVLTVGNSRELRSLSLLNYNFLKVGFTNNKILNVTMDKYNKPYYFVLDSNMNATMFFFPQATTPNLTIKYFEDASNMIASYKKRLFDQ